MRSNQSRVSVQRNGNTEIIIICRIARVQFRLRRVFTRDVRNNGGGEGGGEGGGGEGGGGGGALNTYIDPELDLLLSLLKYAPINAVSPYKETETPKQSETAGSLACEFRLFRKLPIISARTSKHVHGSRICFTVIVVVKSPNQCRVAV